MGGRGSSSSSVKGSNTDGKTNKTSFIVKTPHGDLRLHMTVKEHKVLGADRTLVTVSRETPKGARVGVATAEFTNRSNGTLYPEHVITYDGFRRMGIASRMYSEAERFSGRRVVASETQTADGKGFSAAFRARRS